MINKNALSWVNNRYRRELYYGIYIIRKTITIII